MWNDLEPVFPIIRDRIIEPAETGFEENWPSVNRVSLNDGIWSMTGAVGEGDWRPSRFFFFLLFFSSVGGVAEDRWLDELLSRNACSFKRVGVTSFK